MASDAPYKCHAPWPKKISENPDITGQGVIIGYIATSGIAVLLILVYFLAIHDPSLDHVEKNGASSTSSIRGNPVDTIFLRAVRYIPRYCMGNLRFPKDKLERSFIKCIVAMSDTQLVTGFSILISGFVQLRQGLQSYHWLAIVDLAWFSSITHLACLTFLRGHLRNHSLERTFRVIAMACLAMMLIVALSFTSTYWWALIYGKSSVLEVAILTESNTIQHPAICHMGIQAYDVTIGLYDNPDVLFFSVGYISMIVSMLLIVLGFVFRVMKLYRVLSVGFIQNVRFQISAYVRRLLRVVYLWCCPKHHIPGLRRGLIYRPLLALFLSTRLLMDLWSSMLLEVLWLLVAFSWGIMRLMTLLQVTHEMFFEAFTVSENDNSQWGFGQVVAVFLLIVPLITFVEAFGQDETHNKSDTHSSVSIPLHDLSAQSNSALPSSSYAGTDIRTDPEDPDSDWNKHTEVLGTALTYTALMVIALVIFAFKTVSWAMISAIVQIRMPIILIIPNFFALMLLSLMIEADVSFIPQIPCWARKLLLIAVVLITGLSTLLPIIMTLARKVATEYLIFGPLSYPWLTNWAGVIVVASCYLVCIIIMRFVGSRPRSSLR
ncbi:uncharacterized protein N7500_004068 [Penicillium coprophilum]|uniref:uncharacterized protein n=1 Tax=Penicillium coprophilum TaxID=36646 RepID=UPI002394FD97|nr:uncharacterized protein N7500_004068 [Penicillium coprophilum]KAJ5171285.1 hypothetical protein N7500_004068 [Penicillium coprophilum]